MNKLYKNNMISIWKYRKQVPRISDYKKGYDNIIDEFNNFVFKMIDDGACCKGDYYNNCYNYDYEGDGNIPYLIDGCVYFPWKFVIKIVDHFLKCTHTDCDNNKRWGCKIDSEAFNFYS